MVKLTGIEVASGNVLPPWYYGHTRVDWSNDASYFHVIPFNYIIRWAVALKWSWDHWRSNLSRAEYMARELFHHHLSKEKRITLAEFHKYFLRVVTKIGSGPFQEKNVKDENMMEVIKMRMMQELTQSLFEKRHTVNMLTYSEKDKDIYEIGYYILTSEELGEIIKTN